MADNLSLTLAGISKAVRELNRPHHESQQEKVGKLLFEWWWGTSDQPSGCCLWSKDGVEPMTGVEPKWEDCTDHAQAHWMEGAWRVMNG